MKYIYALALVALAASAVACGESTVRTKPDPAAKSPGEIAREQGDDPDSGASRSQTDTDGDGVYDLYDDDPNDAAVPGQQGEEEEQASAPQPETAAIGDSITVEGNDGLVLSVRLLKVLVPPSVGEFDAPVDEGSRLVGVRLRITNRSDGVVYSDSPSNGMALIYGNDQQSDSTIVTGGACGGGFSSSVKLRSGKSRQGCVVFEVPATRKVKELQFTPDSGFADQTAEWSLR